MGTVLNPQDLSKLYELKKRGKTIVLVGGCFDILHSAHIEFLKRSRRLGDLLIVFLESDEKIKELKGDNRPVNTQKQRASVLANLSFVSFVYCLPYMSADQNYEILVKKLEPDIIAITGGSKVFDWERDYINNTGGKIVEVMERVPNLSTSKIAQTIKL